MARNVGHAPTLTPQQARQASKQGVRWVLYASLGLCVVAGIVLLTIYG